MKKIIFLLAVCTTLTSMFAGSPRRMECVTTSNENVVVHANSSVIDKEKIDFELSKEKPAVASDLKLNEVEAATSMFVKRDLQTFTLEEVRKMVSVRSDDPVSATYWKPDGTMFIGIDKETYMPRYGGIVGAWLNNVQTWEYPNYSENYTNLSYTNYLIEQDSESYSITKEGNFVDSITPTMKGNPMYLYSWNMPYQLASTDQLVDTFALCTFTKPTKEAISQGLSLTMAGAPYMYDDGMWPLTNAALFDCNYKITRQLIWNREPELQYILGTTPVTVPRSNAADTTLTIAGFHTMYKKPQSPLYVKDITLWITSLGEKTEDGYPFQKPNLSVSDTLYLGIFDADNKLIKSTYATVENLAYYDPGAETTNGYGGGVLTFPLMEKDSYGGIISEGVTLTEAFSIVLFGLDECDGDFGVFAAYAPYTPNIGNTLMLDNQGKYRFYGVFEPFMMLNGVYNTFEDAYPYLVYGDGTKPDSAVNELVFETLTSGNTSINVAVFDAQSGNLKGQYPMLQSSFYPIDTLNNNMPHYELDAPEWIDWLFMDRYWDDLDVVEILLIADDLLAGTTTRQADVILSCYGKSITYHVTQTADGSGVNNPQANLTKVLTTDNSFELSYTADFTTATLYNISGQAIASYELPAKGKFSVSNTEFAKGTYLIRFTGKSTETVKVVK